MSQFKLFQTFSKFNLLFTSNFANRSFASFASYKQYRFQLQHLIKTKGILFIYKIHFVLQGVLLQQKYNKSRNFESCFQIIEEDLIMFDWFLYESTEDAFVICFRNSSLFGRIQQFKFFLAIVLTFQFLFISLDFSTYIHLLLAIH